jgi:Ras-related protein Rab-18
VILVYDIANSGSFQAMERWFEEAETNAIPGAVMYLVGSKLDRAAARTVGYAEGEELAARHGAGFCEVSSKTRENVRKPFVEIVDRIVRSPELLAATSRQGAAVAIGAPEAAGSGCAC